MKYSPRPLSPGAADVSRGHDRHPLRELALLSAALAVICAGLYLVAILITNLLVARISPATEGRLFSVFSSSLPQPSELSPELQDRQLTAERLLARLFEKADLKGLPVRLIIWDTSQTNAVALPGGTIAITKGLLGCLDEEVGMAFVLAHELGHFHGRDHLRGLGRRLGLHLLMALVFSSDADLRMGAAHAGEFVMLAHSRRQEAAADRYAMDLVYRSLGTGSGATRLFELLEKDVMPGWAYMLNTHPATVDRIKALRVQAASLAVNSPAAIGKGETAVSRVQGSQTYLGAITRGPLDRRAVALCFTAHEYAEGARVILDALEKHGGKGSFFLTGAFLANTNFDGLIARMIREGHLIGPHSDQHLLYCSWERSRETLISREEFRADLTRNLDKIHRHQLAVKTTGTGALEPVRFFLPPYEHYNAEIAAWTKEMGLTLVNYTPGTRSNADYTGEADKNFVSSQVIYQSILELEARDPHGLNGFLLLLHLGSGPGRKDKFHTLFPQLLEHLSNKGYRLVTVEQLLAPD